LSIFLGNLYYWLLDNVKRRSISSLNRYFIYFILFYYEWYWSTGLADSYIDDYA